MLGTIKNIEKAKRDRIFGKEAAIALWNKRKGKLRRDPLFGKESAITAFSLFDTLKKC
ncbi:MAG: hypothetical protein GVY04_09510 [Cyanobacteria bacterium]|jgi:hypothetical protein|nr:hypothetical protein [Cyanobacteria bacterium GSL.Bin1]